MSVFSTRHYSLTSCVALALLAGCGASQPPIGAPGVILQSRASSVGESFGPQRGGGLGYQIIYNFEGQPDDGGYYHYDLQIYAPPRT